MHLNSARAGMTRDLGETLAPNRVIDLAYDARKWHRRKTPAVRLGTSAATPNTNCTDIVAFGDLHVFVGHRRLYHASNKDFA